jgi:hypothetical protein
MAQQHAPTTVSHCEACGKELRSESERRQHKDECQRARQPIDPSRMRTQEQNKITSKE